MKLEARQVFSFMGLVKNLRLSLLRDNQYPKPEVPTTLLGLALLFAELVILVTGKFRLTQKVSFGQGNKGPFIRALCNQHWSGVILTNLKMRSHRVCLHVPCNQAHIPINLSQVWVSSLCEFFRKYTQIPEAMEIMNDITR